MSGADAGAKCQHCGNVHATTCPRIKAIEYYQDGTVKRVTFYSPNDYGPIFGGQTIMPASISIPTVR